MRKLQRKTQKTTVVIMMLVVFMTGFLLGAAPGSSNDPLVTKSWVDNYVNKECGALETRIDNLSAKIGGNELCLWIGKNTVTKNGVKSTKTLYFAQTKYLKIVQVYKFAVNQKKFW